MKTREILILLILAGLNFTHILDFAVMMPLGNYLIPYFGITALQFSILVSAYSISAFVAGIITALIIDKFDRKKVLIISYFGFVIGTAACGYADTYYLLLAARIMAGLFGGIIGAQVLAIVADLFTYKRRGIAMGAVMSAFAIASIFGVPYSLELINKFNNDWHIPFKNIATIGALLIPALFWVIPSMKSHIRVGEDRTSSIGVIREVMKMPAARNALLFSCIMMMGHFIIVPFINPFLEFNRGYTKEQIPDIYLYGGTASLFAAVLLGYISDKTGKLVVFTFSVVLSLLVVLIITRMPTVPFSIVLLLFSFLFVFATGRMVTAQAMISEVVPPEKRGSFMSFNGSVQQLGTGVASVLAGLIVYKDKAGQIQHFDRLGYASIIILIISLLMGRVLFSQLDKDVSTAPAHLSEEN